LRWWRIRRRDEPQRVSESILVHEQTSVEVVAVTESAGDARNRASIGLEELFVEGIMGLGTCTPLGSAIASPGTNAVEVGGLEVNSTYAFCNYIGTPPTIIQYTFKDNSLSSVPSTPLSNSYHIQTLTIDATNVDWIGSPSDTLYSAPQGFTTGTTPKVAASSGIIAGLASEGTNLYFGTYSTTGPASLYYVPIGGGTPVVLYTSRMGGAPATSGQGPVAVAGGAVYWADSYNDLFFGERAPSQRRRRLSPLTHAASNVRARTRFP
jgi:hypothetical protein